MLARMVLVICVMMCSGIRAEDLKPNVVVILADQHVQGLSKTTAHGVLDFTFLPQASIYSGRDVAWHAYRGNCQISAGRAATMAAVLYGRPPLQMGIVSDTDWRRRPVAGESMLQLFEKAGYEINRYGEGVVKNTLNHPWGLPKSSQVEALEITDAFSNSFKSKKPWIAMFRQGGVLHDEALARLMSDQLIPYASKSTRPTMVLILRIKPMAEKEERRHHYPANWYFYYHGGKQGFMTYLKHLRPAKTDWELHSGLLGVSNQKIEEYRVFHKANWPSNESPEKYRHRGSLVVGKGHALVDGLELYSATKDLEPDLTKLLDIAEHEKLHAEMLTAHAKWWQKARKALHDPRAFDVGREDEKPVLLTAMDWRLSKIIHKDGTSPSSKPLIYQKHLLGILKGLKEEKYRNAFPAYSGSWSVRVARPGRYRVTTSLLPKEALKSEDKSLAQLQGGRAFIKLGRNQVELRLHKGADTVSALIDADAGVQDLECWFTGQLALERELGAFFVEIERVGDKKFDFKAKVK